jgi:hypothetical protein
MDGEQKNDKMEKRGSGNLRNAKKTERKKKGCEGWSAPIREKLLMWREPERTLEEEPRV